MSDVRGPSGPQEEPKPAETQQPTGRLGSRTVKQIKEKWAGATVAQRALAVTGVALAAIALLAIAPIAAIIVGIAAYALRDNQGLSNVKLGKQKKENYEDINQRELNQFRTAKTGASRPESPRPPLTLKQIKVESAPPKLQSKMIDENSGSSESVGKTLTQQGPHGQEDKIVIGKVGDFRFAGVADGHGGDMPSNKVQENFTSYLSAELANKSITQEEVQNAAARAVYHLDTEIKAEKTTDMGSTLSGALFLQDRCFIINVGDSETLVCTRDQVIAETEKFPLEDPGIRNAILPETPEDATKTEKSLFGETTEIYKWTDEQGIEHLTKKILIEAGYTEERFIHQGDESQEQHLSITYYNNRGVVGTRYNHMKLLADIGGSVKTLVTAQEITYPKEDTFVVSMSDGLTDVLSNENINSLLWEMEDKGFDEKTMAETLVKAAYQRGSQDNLSVTVTRVPGQ